jgi:MraZ protein
MLRGNALAKLDGKGRLKLPTAFRSVVEPTHGVDYFVTSIRGESARIYPMRVYTDLEQRLLEASSFEPKVNKLRTALNYYGQRAAMDSQGRILIHPLLRESARINGEVSVLGMQNFLEVWNLDAFRKKVVGDPLTDDELKDLAALGF